MSGQVSGRLLIGGTFVVAICGLVYELIAGTTSAYLLGNSVQQFSFVIGLFMTSMGLGSFLVRHVQKTANTFILAQFALSVLGGLSALILFMAYGYDVPVNPVLYGLCIAIGTLIGLEVPLVLDLLGTDGDNRIKISDVLTADYLGALVAALAFPLFLLPFLGLVSAAVALGALNLGVGLITAWHFRSHLQPPVWAVGGLCSLLLLCAGVFGGALVRGAEVRGFHHEVIYSQTTPYQRIVVTRDSAPDRTRLFLNDALQFDTLDEYRYHEALVWPALTRHPNPEKVLILGGGDGLGAKQLLEDARVNSIDLVDLDPAITHLFSSHSHLSTLSDGSLSDPRVNIINADAWTFLDGVHPYSYDLIFIDLPDPRTLELSRLYTDAFYHRVFAALRGDGLMVTQATSPTFAPRAFWTIAASVAAGDSQVEVHPYQAYVPSFGMWGFVLAGRNVPAQPAWAQDLPHKFYTATTEQGWFVLPPDLRAYEDQAPNRLSQSRLPHLYENGWDQWYD